MKSSFICFFLFSGIVISQTESDSSWEMIYRFSATYNVNTVIPGETNRDERWVDDLEGFKQSNRVAAPLAGLFATLTILPVNDFKALIIRFGRMTTKYEFGFSTSQTDNNGAEIGTVQTTITERYLVYPVSIGAAYSTPQQEMQFYGEAIYALGYLDEEYSISPTNGTAAKFTNSYRGTALGYQLGIIINPKFGTVVGLHLEGGYRGLRFYQFEDPTTNFIIPLDLSLSSFYFNAGFSFIL